MSDPRQKIIRFGHKPTLEKRVAHLELAFGHLLDFLQEVLGECPAALELLEQDLHLQLIALGICRHFEHGKGRAPERSEEGEQG